MTGFVVQGHILSQIQPLWLPPITTRGNCHQSINRSIRTSFPTYPVPETEITCTGVSHCSVCLNCATLALFVKSCFAMQSFLSVFPVFAYLLITWTVYPFIKICCLPAYSDPACLIELFYCLSAACLNPQHELCLWICPAFVISDASYWFVLWINKAAHGSWRHCLLITHIVKI